MPFETFEKIFMILRPVLFILAFILVLRAVNTSFRKLNKSLDKEAGRDEDDDADDGGAPRAQRETEERWREAAKRISCTFDPGTDPRGRDASITGRFSGHVVTIRRFGRSYVRYFVAFRRAPAFQVCVVRDLDTIAERILNGRPVFPSKKFVPPQEPDFFCSAESEEAFRRFLEVPSNRSAVLNLVHLFPAGMFTAEGVSVRLRASVPDVSVISDMAAIAGALDSPSGVPMPDLMAAAKRKPVLAPPVQPMPSGVGPAPVPEEGASKRFPPIPVPVPVPAGTTRKTSRIQPRQTDSGASRRTAVIRIVPDAAQVRNSDAAKDSIVRLSDKTQPAAKQPAPVAEQPSAPAAKQPAPVASADASLTVESVCAALFAKPFPGMEERAAFDAMKGRRVSWSGEVQTVLPFSMDFVFGSRKGVKATILVRKQGQGGASAHVKAVAAFPPELRETLDAAKGQTVSFGGELLKFEPFAREIYLQDASLDS